MVQKASQTKAGMNKQLSNQTTLFYFDIIICCYDVLSFITIFYPLFFSKWFFVFLKRMVFQGLRDHGVHFMYMGRQDREEKAVQGRGETEQESSLQQQHENSPGTVSSRNKNLEIFRDLEEAGDLSYST